jgi:hypothetical protein
LPAFGGLPSFHPPISNNITPLSPYRYHKPIRLSTNSIAPRPSPNCRAGLPESDDGIQLRSAVAALGERGPARPRIKRTSPAVLYPESFSGCGAHPDDGR